MNPEAPRLRVLIGTIALIAGLAAYALLAMRLAVAILPESTLAEVVYYGVAGTLWVWPAARLLRWMQAEPGGGPGTPPS
ncbi:MAG TPA: DUF2842 domain-containing protein [Stellaceae bacterium]|nr:DUF2842 domain-containing protein [Stellaceae bacterium]